MLAVKTELVADVTVNSSAFCSAPYAAQHASLDSDLEAECRLRDEANASVSPRWFPVVFFWNIVPSNLCHRTHSFSRTSVVGAGL